MRCVRLGEVVQDSANEPKRLAGRGFRLSDTTHDPRRGGQVGRGWQYHRVGVVAAKPVHLRQGGLQDGKDVFRAREKVVHGLVLNGDGRIFKAQKMFERGL